METKEIVRQLSLRFTPSSRDKKKDYSKIVPKGYICILGGIQDSFVIKNKEDGSEFVWIPVSTIKPNGTIDGKRFNERFGRRNFAQQEPFEYLYDEVLDQALFNSVKKYGGFYISRYHISEEKNGRYVSKYGNMPCVKVTQYQASEIARKYAKGSSFVESCLTTGSAFDSMIEWIWETTPEYQVRQMDSSPSSLEYVRKTGYISQWSIYNIADLKGNVDEWTSEKGEYMKGIIRGCSCKYDWPLETRINYGMDCCSEETGFRILLYLK